MEGIDIAQYDIYPHKLSFRLKFTLRFCDNINGDIMPA